MPAGTPAIILQPVVLGGTGLTSVATGNVLYATGTNVLAAGTPDAAGLLDKSSTAQTKAGALTVGGLNSTAGGTFSGSIAASKGVFTTSGTADSLTIDSTGFAVPGITAKVAGVTKGYWAVAAQDTNFLTESLIGDMVFRSDGNRLLFGVGSASKLIVSSTGVTSSVPLTAAGITSTAGVTSGSSTITGLTLQSGGDSGGSPTALAQIRFGYQGSSLFSHWISTRHNGGSAAGNAFKFFTSDGTSAGTFPTNGVLGLTVENGSIQVPGAITAGSTISPGTYTVATLPTPGTARRMAYASNGRKNGEGSGAGTGVIAFDDGVKWVAVDSGSQVLA